MLPRWPSLALWLAACAGGPAAGYCFAQGVTGTTELQLFVDSTGTVVPDSTRILTSSGVAALDSAALAAVPRLRYVPGQRDGRPVAMPFVQPIQFRPGS
jgi:TonB family protein